MCFSIDYLGLAQSHLKKNCHLLLFGEFCILKMQMSTFNKMSTEPQLHLPFVCFVCLDDLPIKGTQQTPTTSRGYKHQAGNSQSLSYKHWFNVYYYELHKSRNCDSVTRRQ